MKRLPLYAVLLLLAAVPGFGSAQSSVGTDHQFHFPANARLSKFSKSAAQRNLNRSQNSPFYRLRENAQAHSKRRYHRATAGSNPPTGKPTFVSSTQIPTGGYLGFYSGSNSGEPALSGDFNGDGKPDAATIVETDTGYAFSVVLGNGDGTFQSPSLTTITDYCAVLAAGDVNGDGKEDILVVHSANECSNVTSSFDVFLSNGDGTFTQGNNYVITSNQLSGGLLYNVGNGHLDAVVVDQASPGNVWTVLGNGDGTFSTTPTSVGLSGQVSQSALADLNGDGILDVAGLDANTNQVTVYLSASPTSYAAGVPLITSDTNYYADAMSVGDLNGDGFPDIVTANYDGDNVTVYINNQSGGFATGAYYNAAVGGSPSGAASLYTTAVAIADVNGDGKADILTSSSESDQITVLLGNGDGTVNVPALGYSVGGFAGCCPTILTAPVVADFDGDGFQDILIPDNAFSLEFAKGYGDGTFRAAPAYYTAGGNSSYVQTYGVASGDFNGDGIPDIVIGGFNDGGAGTMTVFLSNPDGSMQPGVSYGTTQQYAFVTVADFNKDGKLDIAASDFVDGSVQIFFGNGDGTFTAGATTFPTDTTATGPSDLIAADFNGDGYPDLAVLNWEDGTVAVLINDQTGNFPTFVDYPLLSGGYTTYFGIAAGDVDGNGKLDLAIPVAGTSTVALLMGNGDGTFQPESSTTDISIGTYYGIDSLALADLDGDGNLDMAVTLSEGGGDDVLILYGTGGGAFNTSTPTVLASSLQDWNLGSPDPLVIKAVDIDGDGILDLAYTNNGYGTVGVLYGKGSRSFYDPVEFSATGTPFALAIADVNNDGSLDIVTSGYEDVSGVSVLLNANGSGTIANYTVAPTSQTTASVAAGSSATFTFTVSPTNHYNGTVTFSCGNTLPALATCTFNPPSVTFSSASSAPVSVTLTITTAAITASLQTPQRQSTILLASMTGIGLFGMVFAGSWKKSNRWMQILLAMVTLAVIAATVACGGSSSNNGSSGNNSNPAATSTTVQSSSSTVMAGSSVTFTGTVSSSSGSPTGTVTFLDGTTTLGTGTINNGAATYATSSLAAGVHSITASYAGNSTFKSSTSAALSETVDHPGTPTGSYTVTVSATGTAGTNNGNTSAHPLNFTLTVQ